MLHLYLQSAFGFIITAKETLLLFMVWLLITVFQVNYETYLHSYIIHTDTNIYIISILFMLYIVYIIYVLYHIVLGFWKSRDIFSYVF